MAESIIVHFAGSEISKVNRVFTEFAEIIDDIWYLPSHIDYLIQIYPYKDYLRENDNSEKLDIMRHLGSEPKFSFCIELRRSHQKKACNFAKRLLKVELVDFNFVVDDCIDKIWTNTEIQTYENEFLRHYY